MSASTVHGQTSFGRRVVLGLVVAAALAALGFLVDIDVSRVVSQLRGANPRYLALAFLASLVAQLAWASVTALFVATLDDDIPAGRIRLGYFAGTFAKQVLPFGHAGGVPLLSYVFASDLGLDYRRTFAAVTASELVIFLSSLVVAAAGLVWFLLVDAHLGARGVVFAALLVLALAVLVGSAARFGQRAIRRFAHLLAAVGRLALGRLIPRTRRRLSPDAVDRGIDGFFGAFERATADNGTVVAAGALALGGWVCFSLPLFLGFRAVGLAIPLSLSLVLVPAGGLAAFLPVPGGLGGTEAGTAAAVVALTSVTVDVATAGVLLSRLASYWFVVLVGGLCSLYLSVGLRNLRLFGE